MKEYAFDVKLWSVCRVKAKTEAEARKKMLDRLSQMDGPLFSWNGDQVVLGSASIEDDDGETSELIEIDGEAV